MRAGHAFQMLLVSHTLKHTLIIASNDTGSKPCDIFFQVIARLSDISSSYIGTPAASSPSLA